MSVEDLPREPATISAERLLVFPLFEGVDPRLVARIVEASSACVLEDGCRLLDRGSVNRHLFVVVAGRLRIHLDLQTSSIADLGPGDTVGEISVFDRLPTSAHAVAVGACTLLRLHESAVWQMVESSHAFARNLLVLLTGRIRRANALVDRSLQLQREHHRNATIDALTGLYNRRWMDEMLAFEMSGARQRQLPLGVLMLDVDHFKAYNDQFGHQAGDAVLRGLAEAMHASLRHVDMAVRYGGEEFLVLLPGVSPSEVMAIAERLRGAVARMRLRLPDGTAMAGVTVSIGAGMMHDGDDVATLIARIDQALYRAKAEGRDRICAAGPMV